MSKFVIAIAAFAACIVPAYAAPAPPRRTSFWRRRAVWVNVATVAAAIAVGPVGTASLAVIAEKPEVFGRTLVYLGLAEGIAIYGLVVTILLLGKI